MTPAPLEPTWDFEGTRETAIAHFRRIGADQFGTLILALKDVSDDDGPAVGVTLDGDQDTLPFFEWLDDTHTGVLAHIRVIMPTITPIGARP